MSQRLRFLAMEALDRHSIYDVILDSCSPATTFRLKRTCRRAYDCVTDYVKRAFNINTHLSRFFTDPIEFRRLQRRTRTLLSGSGALQYLDRTFYPESDLDLYVHKEHVFEVGQWIVHLGGKGYRFVAFHHQQPDFADAVQQHEARTHYHPYPERVMAVFTFQAEEVDGILGPKVQIITTKACPIDGIIAFHSTVVCNMISDSHAYAFYAKATFEDRYTVVLKHDEGERTDAALEKYRDRGWKVLRTLSPSPDDPEAVRYANEFESMLGERWVDDKHSWVLPLNMAEVVDEPTGLDFDAGRIHSWDITRSSGNKALITCGLFCDEPSDPTTNTYSNTIASEAFRASVIDWMDSPRFVSVDTTEESWWEKLVMILKQQYLARKEEVLARAQAAMAAWS